MHETILTNTVVTCTGCNMHEDTSVWAESIREQETERLRHAHERFANGRSMVYTGPEYEVASDGFSGD